MTVENGMSSFHFIFFRFLVHCDRFGLDIFLIKIYSVLITIYSDNFLENFRQGFPVTAYSVSHEVYINSGTGLNKNTNKIRMTI